MRAETVAALHEIGRRRMEAFRAGEGKGLSSREHLALIPEATTPEDFDTLYDAIDQLDDDAKLVIALVKDMWREWGKYRCSVCALTPKQAAAIGYDCISEC
jgi:hypothetical protein